MVHIKYMSRNVDSKHSLNKKYVCQTHEGILTRYRDSHKTYMSKEPHPRLILAKVEFKQPYPTFNDVSFLSLACMELLLLYAYPALEGYGKFTITLTMISTSGEVSFSVGPAISLTCTEGIVVFEQSEVYSHIYGSLLQHIEKYKGLEISGLSIRVYLDGIKIMKDRTFLSDSDRSIRLSELHHAEMKEIEPRAVKKISPKKKGWSPPPRYIRTLKQSSDKMRPIIVADTETIMFNDVHHPYAAGLLIVRPGENLDDKMDNIECYFSEDYSIILDSFPERSNQVLFRLIERMSMIVRKEKEIRSVYFHNFAKFDGILLLKYLASSKKNYSFKPLMRNNFLYEVVVYAGKTKLFSIKDSLMLLPGKLADLAKNLCPNLGSKGSLNYEEINLSNLISNKKTLLDYMKQDILLLGGVMQKAQDIYWNAYKINIETMLTISSVALSIFRMRYYDDQTWPIHIPSQNEDSFIRCGYYGGHVDVYKPYGENLYYYDVNSLYPFIMSSFDMPGGTPKWYNNFQGMKLENLFGFLEAYIECPQTLNKPFLPYRDKNQTLIFTTGVFIGVYYSEELKYAKSIGYTVIPLKGYLFERMKTPFSGFVSSLFEGRLNAKKEGNDAMAYIYKIVMNSLYGRFGINPRSTITDICSRDEYQRKLRYKDFLYADELSEQYTLVSYWSFPSKSSSMDFWNPPRISAVQISAAITACARIHMYPFIANEDCYYTDTDSVVLGKPLPEKMISSFEIGKFKLEHRIRKGYFLAPKSYSFINYNESFESTQKVLKHKGPAKDHVSFEWFEKQYNDLNQSMTIMSRSNFRIDWHNLNITTKDNNVTLRIPVGTKRKPILRDNKWVDTEPFHLTLLDDKINQLSIDIINMLKDTLQQLSPNSLIKDLLEKRELVQTAKGIDRKKENAMIPMVEDKNPSNKSKWLDEFQILLEDPDNLSSRVVQAPFKDQNGKQDRQAECGTGESSQESPKPKDKGNKYGSKKVHKKPP